MNKADSIPTTRRAFVQRSATALAVGAAVPAVIIPKAAQAAEQDPIFAAIEAHERAAVLDKGASDAAADLWAEAYNKACIALFTTKPTTLAGVVAVLEYVNEPEHGDPPSYSILANTSFQCTD